MTRDEMISLLREGTCYVEFEKKDGTLREMKCTLSPTYIPEDKMPKTEAEYSDTVIRVFEIPLEQWRSFRVDSVSKFEKV